MIEVSKLERWCVHDYVRFQVAMMLMGRKLAYLAN
jgi:hypothetical protein